MNVPLKYEEFSRWLFMGAFVILSYTASSSPLSYFYKILLPFIFLGKWEWDAEGENC